MKLFKQYKTILTVAILLRLLLMPFLFHPDIKTQYFHANFFSQGVTNIYQFIAEQKHNLPYKDTFNYPPLAYYTLGSINVVLSPFTRQSFQNWLKDWGPNVFTSDHIFRDMFLLKLPYLFLDLSLGLILATLLSKEKQKTGLILWFFNPITLYAIYGLANFDLIPTFTTLLALFLIQKQKYPLAGICFGLGVALKLFPLLLLPLFLIYLFYKTNFKQSLIFLSSIILVFILSILPTINDFLSITSSGLINKLFASNILGIPIFIPFYALIVITFIFSKKTLSHLIIFSSLVFLAVYILSRYHPQWILWSMPFVTLILSQNKKLLFFGLTLLISFFLSVLAFQDRFLTLGILSPIFPNIYDVAFLEELIFSKININIVTITSTTLLVITTLGFIFFGFKSHSTPTPKYQNIIFTSLFIISTATFIALLVLCGVFLGNRSLISSQTDETTEIPLNQQTFSTPLDTKQDNLYLVFIKIRNPERKNLEPLNFTIKNETGDTIREIKLAGQNIGLNDWVKFQFEPISSQKLFLQLTPTISQNPLSIVTNDQEVLAYKAYARLPFGQALTQNLTNFKNRFFKDPFFAYFYLISFSLLLLFTLYTLSQAPSWSSGQKTRIMLKS